MKIYNKPPLTYKDQIALLKSRGLLINDESRTIRHLSNISYYRLSAYMLPFKIIKNGSYTDAFKPNVSWDNVYNLYIFDRKLRLLIFDIIERLEISIRTQIIYQLSHKYGSHWQDDSTIFKPIINHKNGKVVTIDIHKELQQHIAEQLTNNKAEVFIQHYRNTYSSPLMPPSWMSVEIMYFNHLSKICSCLKNRKDIVDIANFYSLPPDHFCSWLHTINYVRNLCAHHARLWNRDFNIVPQRLDFSKKLKWINSPNTVQRKKMYYFLCMVNYMLQTVNPTSDFRNKLFDLLNEFQGVISLKSMGFPKNWESESIWEK